MKNLVLSPFNVIPPHFGGAERIYNLMTRIGEATVIALNWDGVDQEGKHGDINYRLISAEPEAVEQARKLSNLGIRTYDGMPALTKNNLKKLWRAIEEENPDQIILEHPWLIPFVGDVPFLLDCHNAEHYLTYSRWPQSYDEQIVENLEREALTKAQKVTVCSEVDALLMKKHYGIEKDMVYIPNGTDIPNKVSEGKTKNLIFIGSMYGPNVRAAQELANLAKFLPEYTIQILGACAKGVRKTSDNVELVGVVTEEQKESYFLNAYAMVNLVLQGSGTNLKNARAMAYGLPVITTKVGSRGFPTAIVAENLSTVPELIRSLDFRKEQEKNRAYAESISWDVVGKAFRDYVTRDVGQDRLGKDEG